MAIITSLSSRGQIVLPISIRKKLGLKEGTQFLVLSDEDNILLKPVKESSIDEFRSLMAEAQRWASEVGMTEDDISSSIQSVRNDAKDENSN